jgi:toxin FitB
MRRRAMRNRLAGRLSAPGSPGSADRGARRRAAGLTAWLDMLVHLYAERILPFDVPEARITGGLADRARSKGQAPGLAEVVIATTAQLRDLTILTRNARHFEPLGVPFVDPFVQLPPARSPAP